MPSFPEGVAWPPSAEVWQAAVEDSAARPAAAYIHIPFCTVRCGYCDFNTYTKGFGSGADLATYADSVIAEVDYSRSKLPRYASPFRSVFFGGGTPTLLEASALGRILAHLRRNFGIEEDAEVTVEANPETLTREKVRALQDFGVNRLSLGMQSAVPSVLAVLDRVHTPAQVPRAVEWAKDAGMQVSVDLIYGAPTETVAQWEESLQLALSYEPDHVSAYSLIVEPGTKLAAQIARGEVCEPNEELAAQKYELTDALTRDAGYRWYEISNFAKMRTGEEMKAADKLANASKHNRAYWRDWNWWGYGPGAHSHWGDLRWWNVKHPTAYAGRTKLDQSPAFQGEILDAHTRQLEKLMLGIRTAEGVPATNELAEVPRLLDEELIQAEALAEGRVILTLRGRLFADYVTRVLLGWESS